MHDEHIEFFRPRLVGRGFAGGGGFGIRAGIADPERGDSGFVGGPRCGGAVADRLRKDGGICDSCD